MIKTLLRKMNLLVLLPAYLVFIWVMATRPGVNKFLTLHQSYQQATVRQEGALTGIERVVHYFYAPATDRSKTPGKVN